MEKEIDIIKKDLLKCKECVPDCDNVDGVCDENWIFHNKQDCINYFYEHPRLFYQFKSFYYIDFNDFLDIENFDTDLIWDFFECDMDWTKVRLMDSEIYHKNVEDVMK
jgi:hypothetical protein